MAKILLAEDEQNIASFIRRGLQEFGHEVQVAHNGGTAWAMLQEGVFDLLVLDVIMPKMDGLSVMEKFSHNVRTGNFGVTTSCWIATPAVHGAGIR